MPRTFLPGIDYSENALAKLYERKLKDPNSSSFYERMKLVVQITAAIVLAWIVITAAKSVLAHTALAAFAGALERMPTPAISAGQPASNNHHNAPSEPPPIAAPPTREQLDAYIRADEARAKAEHDAQYGSTTEKPAPVIRKATPDDATAKPAR
jgi:hypothetical protein